MSTYSTRLIKYSIIRGGPFYRLQELLRLVDRDDPRVAVRAVVFVIVALLIMIAPLTVFTARLIGQKLRRLHDYGVLANNHSLLFDNKWIQQAENMGSVLGAPDISSLADLSTGYQTVQSMKVYPFRLQNLIGFVAAVGIPMIPLVLIEIPFRELVLKIGGALL